MSTGAKSFYRDWSSRMSHAKASVPDAAKGFGALYQGVMKPGAIGGREKEFVALGIGIALRCEPCIYTHVDKALQAGATREQVMEVAGVAVMMQGGPGYTYLPVVIEALDAIEAREADGAGTPT